MASKYKHIELFAGCGGLALGLEKYGFQLVLANELSPMASETFAHNILGITDLDGKGRVLQPEEKIYWVKSKIKREDLAQRLKEDPRDAEYGPETDFDDLPNGYASLEGALLVGSIRDLNARCIADNGRLGKILRRGFAKKGPTRQIDLISGGPPCQSFSMAGMRQRANARNQLPAVFADFVDIVQPKMVLLENVTGILRAFSVGNRREYAWIEVCKAFVSKGYVPLCLHVNAKYVGAGQNRPRFIMLAFRKDQIAKLKRAAKNEKTGGFLKALKESVMFFNGETDVPILYDSDSGRNGMPDLFRSKYFRSLVESYDEKKWVSVHDAIDDLKTVPDDCSKLKEFIKKRGRQSAYVRWINHDAFCVPEELGKEKDFLPKNLKHRNNQAFVQARFRLYQVLSELENEGEAEVSKAISRYLRARKANDVPNDVPKDVWKKLNGRKLLTVKLAEQPQFKCNADLLRFLRTLHTRKQTQKALVKDKPAPAAMSIPDDVCHYDPDLQRTLSVREMARIQSFPDWFEFKSKETTGGKMRQFQVPQYTQVGNAVPPLLGLALGEVCEKLLEAMNEK